MRNSILLMCLTGAALATGCTTTSAQVPVSMPQLEARADQACHGISDAAQQRSYVMEGVTEAEPLVESHHPMPKLKFRRTTGVELHRVAHRGITGPYLRRVTMCQVAQNTLLAAQGQPHDLLFGPGVEVQVKDKSYGFQILIRGESPEHARKLVQLADAALIVPNREDIGEQVAVQ